VSAAEVSALADGDAAASLSLSLLPPHAATVNRASTTSRTRARTRDLRVGEAQPPCC
jgi:hypothetical protein